MSLIKCKDKRNTCGVPLPSTCVSYEGSFIGVLKEEDFPCNVNLNDVIEKLSTVIKNLTDLEKLNNNSQNTEISTIKNDITEIKGEIAEINGNNLPVVIDLSSLNIDTVYCQVSPHRYTIYTILNLLKNEIVSLKAQI